jgi:hypothetical protein
MTPLRLEIRRLNKAINARTDEAKRLRAGFATLLGLLSHHEDVVIKDKAKIEALEKRLAEMTVQEKKLGTLP